MAPFLLFAYLLATGAVRGDGRGRATRTRNSVKRRVTRKGRGRGGDAAATAAGRGGLGRNRYTRDGIKKRPANDSKNDSSKQGKIHPIPPLTALNGPRPSYYSCRHNYEDALIDEIQRFVRSLGSGGEVIALSPCPGLVRVEGDIDLLPSFYDPVYALQSIPNCVVVTAESIKGIAREVTAALLGDESDAVIADETSHVTRQRFSMAQRGSLVIHPLVPGMCKGQTNPFWLRRSEKIGEELSTILKKRYPAARKVALDNDGNRIQPNERWALQMMLQSPNVAVASLAECRHVGPGQNAYWPNSIHPLGLAKVDITERMPSSAYRKLMEGIECMGVRPLSTSTVVDLGACPGGWTAVMRRYFGCRVISVDRSELDPSLMNDRMVEFVKGDAFAFEPPEKSMGDDVWMISDVIAYPERATELLRRWCAEKWASNMIVTMKFQGDEPDFDELNNAINVVEDLGYRCRVKHFFNNKNEVTFLVSQDEEERNDLEMGSVGISMHLTL